MRSSCRHRSGPVEAKDPAPSACAVPANEVLLADAEVCRTELADRGGRPSAPLVGTQLNPLGAAAEDHREQEPLDLRVDARPPHARVEQRSADLRACRVVRIEQDRGNADGAPALPDGEGRPEAVCEPGPDDLIQYARVGRS
jgi:hypothetical protein